MSKYELSTLQKEIYETCLEAAYILKSQWNFASLSDLISEAGYWIASKMSYLEYLALSGKPYKTYAIVSLKKRLYGNVVRPATLHAAFLNNLSIYTIKDELKSNAESPLWQVLEEIHPKSKKIAWEFLIEGKKMKDMGKNLTSTYYVYKSGIENLVIHEFNKQEKMKVCIL